MSAVFETARQLSALEEEFERQLEIQKQMVSPHSRSLYVWSLADVQESVLETKSAQVLELSAEARAWYECLQQSAHGVRLRSRRRS